MRRGISLIRRSAMRAMALGPARMPVLCRWQSTTSAGSSAAASAAASAASEAAQQTTKETQAQAQTAEPSQATRRASVMATMARAAEARREIYDLWRTTSDEEQLLSKEGSADQEKKADAARVQGVGEILNRYNIDVTSAREEDVCRGLGDAIDRLLLLCVPLPPSSGTEQIERILHAAGRQGRQLSVRTVQHLFARTSTFAEALAIFYALRRCHFAMSMESYHAMLYSLQRLEEEGWALRFHDEHVANEGAVSEQALDFVLRGVDNALIPENKPWLGRVTFAEQPNAASVRQTRESYDELDKLWVDRYKGTESVPRV